MKKRGETISKNQKKNKETTQIQKIRKRKPGTTTQGKTKDETTRKNKKKHLRRILCLKEDPFPGPAASSRGLSPNSSWL